MASSLSTTIDMKSIDIKCDEKSRPSSNSSLTIEKTSFLTRLRRGFSYDDDGGYTLEMSFGSLLILAFWAFIGYIIYVYGFHGGNWNPY